MQTDDYIVVGSCYMPSPVMYLHNHELHVIAAPRMALQVEVVRHILKRGMSKDCNHLSRTH